jgi:hypothetical protein
MQIHKEKFDFTDIIGKMVTFRNGEKLIVTAYKHFPETNYQLCHALSFESINRYMLFNNYGRKSPNRLSDHDIIEVE